MNSSHPGAPKPESALPHYDADVPVDARATSVSGSPAVPDTILPALFLRDACRGVDLALVYMAGLYLFRLPRQRGVSDPAADFALF